MEQFAVVTPGSMIVLSVLISAGILGSRLSMRERACIVVGVGLVGYHSLSAGAEAKPHTYLFFVFGGLLWAVYTVCSKKFAVSPLHATAVVSVFSMAVYLPFYFSWRCCHVFQVPPRDILLQAIYQGVLVSIVALFFYSKSVQLLGPSIGSTFAALVPAAAIILAPFLLGEFPGANSIAGLLVVTGGMFLTLLGSGRLNFPSQLEGLTHADRRRNAAHAGDFRVQTTEKVRFADTDRQGHVNNAVFATFLESGRVEILYAPRRPLAEPGSLFVLARLVVDFKFEIVRPGTIQVGTRVVSIGPQFSEAGARLVSGRADHGLRRNGGRVGRRCNPEVHAAFKTDRRGPDRTHIKLRLLPIAMPLGKRHCAVEEIFFRVAMEKAVNPVPTSIYSTEHLLVYTLLQLAIIILAVHAAGSLARRVGQTMVVGEIIVGLLLGSSCVGTLAPDVFHAVFSARRLPRPCRWRRNWAFYW